NNAGFPPAPPEAHQRAVGANLRGLAIRTEYARAREVLKVNPYDDDACISLDIALLEAGFLGHAEWCHSESRIPAMFADEPRLLRAWQQGQDAAALEFLAAP
ncbi:unnamed protein product, partial [marine sediment metagenome]